MADKNFDLDVSYLLGRHIDESYYSKVSTKRKGKGRELSPQMEPYGGGELSIAVVGESPGREEDNKNKPFRGKSGKVLKRAFSKLNISLDKDLRQFNLVQCRPLPPAVDKANKFPAKNIVVSCMQQRLDLQLAEYKPDLILCFGENVYNYMLEASDSRRVDMTWQLARKTVFWSNKYNCKIGFSYHPAHVVYNNDDDSVRHLFNAELKHLLEIGSHDFPKLDENTGNKILIKYKEIKELLSSWIADENLKPFSFDLETRGLNPYVADAKILIFSIAFSSKIGYGVPIDFPSQGSYWPGWTETERKDIVILLQQLLQHKTLKIAQNRKFDMRWVIKHLGVWPTNVSFCTQHTAHLLDERKGLSGLKTQVFCLAGSTYDSDIDVKRLEMYPLQKAVMYGILDARYTKMIQQWQLKIMDKHLLKGHKIQEKVLHVFARMEQRGIKIDLEELDKQYKAGQKKIDRLKRECADLFGKKFYSKEGKRLNINSPDQLATLFYSILGIDYDGRKTATGKYKVDAASLIELKDRVKSKEIKIFITKVIDCKKTTKFLKTYLHSWRTLVDEDNLIHPSFDLMTDTIRSNSHDPNLQNVPKRDEEQKVVRKCIIPKFDYFLEGDGKAMEVAVMAMVSEDKILTKQIKDRVDIHSKWAAKLFDVATDRVAEKNRDFTKSNFVFPKFYGSQDDSICGHFMQAGYNLPKKHIIHCIRMLENEYKDLFEWQEQTKQDYKRTGYVEMPTGFRRRGPLDEKQVINTPIQHLATWIMFGGMVEIDKIMIGERFKSGMNIEVHDAVTVDTVSDELDDVFDIVDREFRRNRWPWMRDVPITVSWTFGTNWLSMEKI